MRALTTPRIPLRIVLKPLVLIFATIVDIFHVALRESDLEIFVFTFLLKGTQA
jgi:hypothetical protein